MGQQIYVDHRLPREIREKVIEDLRKRGHEAVLRRKGVRTGIFDLRCVSPETLQALSLSMAVCAMVTGHNRRLPKVEGRQWRQAFVGGTLDAAVILEKQQEERWEAGEWIMPRTPDWIPKTWVKIEHLTSLPREFLNGSFTMRVKGGKATVPNVWLSADASAPYLRQKELSRGEWSLKGEKIIQRCEPWKKFMMSVAGWPLKYVPIGYLLWYLYDGTVGREDRTWAEVKEDGELIYRTRVMEKKIEARGELKEAVEKFFADPVIRAEVKEYERFFTQDPDLEYNGFYGTGRWNGKTFYLPAVDPERTRAGGGVGVPVEEFDDLGTSWWGPWSSQGQPLWLSTGRGRTRSERIQRSARMGDGDPTPSGWQLGLVDTTGTGARIWDTWTPAPQEEMAFDGVERKASKSRAESWRRGLAILEECHHTARRYWDLHCRREPFPPAEERLAHEDRLLLLLQDWNKNIASRLWDEDLAFVMEVTRAWQDAYDWVTDQKETSPWFDDHCQEFLSWFIPVMTAEVAKGLAEWCSPLSAPWIPMARERWQKVGPAVERRMKRREKRVQRAMAEVRCRYKTELKILEVFGNGNSHHPTADAQMVV